jgi:NAD(P)-dependent dehydrogenase (short-subunit alcohol dehydrogenase family)
MSTKTYVVTGAAKPGIGEAITRSLVEKGWNVIGTFDDEDENNAAALTNTIGESVTMYRVDHSSRKSLTEFISKVSCEVDGLINAEFFFNMEDIDNINYELWDKSLLINLTCPNFLIHSLKNKFKDGASVVVITSTEGFIGSFGASAYAASKAAIHNLVKTFANNLGSRNIRVNAVAAGWIGGVMDTDEVFNMSRSITPLKRLGSAEEVAGVVGFLISQDSAFVTGTVITTDGGYTGVDTIAKYEFEHSKE